MLQSPNACVASWMKQNHEQPSMARRCRFWKTAVCSAMIRACRALQSSMRVEPPRATTTWILLLGGWPALHVTRARAGAGGAVLPKTRAAASPRDSRSEPARPPTHTHPRNGATDRSRTPSEFAAPSRARRAQPRPSRSRPLQRPRRGGTRRPRMVPVPAPRGTRGRRRPRPSALRQAAGPSLSVALSSAPVRRGPRGHATTKQSYGAAPAPHRCCAATEARDPRPAGVFDELAAVRGARPTPSTLAPSCFGVSAFTQIWIVSFGAFGIAPGRSGWRTRPVRGTHRFTARLIQPVIGLLLVI